MLTYSSFGVGLFGDPNSLFLELLRILLMLIRFGLAKFIANKIRLLLILNILFKRFQMSSQLVVTQ